MRLPVRARCSWASGHRIWLRSQAREMANTDLKLDGARSFKSTSLSNSRSNLGLDRGKSWADREQGGLGGRQGGRGGGRDQLHVHGGGRAAACESHSGRAAGTGTACALCPP